jgi:SAM-dependent methyltransferase
MDKEPSVLSSSVARQPAPRARRSVALVIALGWCRGESLLYHGVQRSHRFIMKSFQSAHRLAGAAFSECLRSDEKSLLTVKIYDFYPGYMDVGDNLHAIEETWFATRLPPAPCEVLVGACGTGREAIALAARGYHVEAFEPAPAFVAESRRRLAGRARVTQLSYEQLSAALLDGSPPANGPLSQRYDAIILGGGSLTHVLEPREQKRLLTALTILCPRGPILASFFCSEGQERQTASDGRATRIGRLIGRAIARLRGVAPMSVTQLSYKPHSGFAYSFTECEIEALGASAGRRTAWERQNGPLSNYATFLPP